MVMIFQVEVVRNFLLENGVVFTVRRAEKFGKPIRKGKDWATHKRTGKKIADILIHPLGLYHSHNLLSHLCDPHLVYYDHHDKGKPFSKQCTMVDFSGFNSFDEWKEAVRETYGKDLTKPNKYFRIFMVTIPGHPKMTRKVSA